MVELPTSDWTTQWALFAGQMGNGLRSLNFNGYRVSTGQGARRTQDIMQCSRHEPWCALDLLTSHLVRTGLAPWAESHPSAPGNPGGGGI
ncbi:MAG: hypothetical protein CBC48_01000 [bacterium TMED88]|nr:hypothetical protein [Deltaproteobacteria bacterium]OUV37226.1 MAG: hypothetical protein CBC48_01000 [bacterium TMED88]